MRGVIVNKVPCIFIIFYYNVYKCRITIIWLIYMMEIQQCQQIGLLVVYRSQLKRGKVDTFQLGEKIGFSFNSVPVPCLFEGVNIDVSCRIGGTPLLIL